MTNKVLSEEERLALPCYDKPSLWQDSHRSTDRMRAAAKCLSSCEQRAWCRAERKQAVDLGYPGYGVWHGEYFPERRDL